MTDQRFSVVATSDGPDVLDAQTGLLAPFVQRPSAEEVCRDLNAGSSGVSDWGWSAPEPQIVIERKERRRSEMLLGPVTRTERGFEIIEFKDRYGESCQLQQSSLAEYTTPGVSAVWLGLAGSDRIHLDFEQVKNLVETLTLWIENGSFSPTAHQNSGAASPGFYKIKREDETMSKDTIEMKIRTWKWINRAGWNANIVGPWYDDSEPTGTGDTEEEAVQDVLKEARDIMAALNRLVESPEVFRGADQY